MPNGAKSVISDAKPLVISRKPRQPSIRSLVALAPASDRVLEPRLSGGFAWAPYRGPARSTDPAPDDQIAALREEILRAAERTLDVRLGIALPILAPVLFIVGIGARNDYG